MNRRLRFAIFERDGFTCQYCGASAPAVRLEVDHVTPRSCRGSDDRDNLLTACFDCNRGKGKWRSWGRGRITPAKALRRREEELFAMADESFHHAVEDLIQPWTPDLLYHDDPALDPEIMHWLFHRGLQWHDIRQALGAVDRYRRARFATIERLQNVFYDNCEYRLGFEDRA